MFQATMIRNAILVLLVTVLIDNVISESCQPIKIEKGLNYLNCSWEGISHIPDPLDDTAEVLDFSNNNFLELPYLSESQQCNDNCHVINDSKVHCRYDVSFSRNDIFTFHEHALHSLRCLRTLDLSYNDIKASILHERTFQEGAYKLENLILRGNPIGELPDNVITAPFMSRIRYIDLSHCQLKEIGENSVDDHAQLSTLNLSYNQLKEIKGSTFKALKNLRVLDLSHNKLKTLGHQVFADLTNLDSLILADNEIVSFARHAFYRDSRLQTLDLSLNSLESVPYQALQELSEIKHLILSYNPMTSVSNPYQSIVMSSVKTLEIEGMGAMTKMSKGSLAAFPSIVTLSLRKNRNLKSIDLEFLADNTPNLREVYLDYNGLHTLYEDSFPWEQLTTMRLDGNPWLCDYRLQWMIRSTAVQPKSVICAGPVQVQGRDIKALHPSLLQRPYTVSYIITIIILSISLPVVAIFGYFLWKRRNHLRCCTDIQGRYVSVYTRDADSDNEDKVDIQVKINHRRLKAVSNGNADDSQPFITMEKPAATEDKEEEEDL